MTDAVKRIVVFASGGGSNFNRIHERILDGTIKGEIVLLISNNPEAGAVAYARKNGIKTAVINRTRYPETEGYNDAYHQLIDPLKPDLLVLAGFMKLIPASVVARYSRRIMNIHPALLPGFGGKGYYGLKVHRAVLASGVKLTGVTVHFVDEEYDRGPIAAQRAVPVLPGDTAESIAARVLIQEHQIYPDVVAAFCEDRIYWQDDKAYIKDQA